MQNRTAICHPYRCVWSCQRLCGWAVPVCRRTDRNRPQSSQTDRSAVEAMYCFGFSAPSTPMRCTHRRLGLSCMGSNAYRFTLPPAPDSLIASGKINFLEPSLQQPVQAIFKRIKMHNEFLSTTRSMRDQQQEGPMQENVHTYYEWMDKSEVSLKREIPRMMKELEDHFKIQHRTAA